MQTPTQPPSPWTLKALVAQVALALEHMSLDQDSGRVSDIPSARTIRYYTTHGLMDKPLGFKGRTALYGAKHLLQIIAIKRLQTLGLTLGEIQDRLAGLDEAALQEVARLPEALQATGVMEASAAQDTKQEASAPFWERLPAQVNLEQEDVEPAQEAMPAGFVQGVQLTEQVTLMLQPPGRALDIEDLDAIRAAAGPLLALLKKRRLIQ